MEDPIIEAVIAQMRIDFEMGDTTAIYELLEHIPKKNLLAYLPEWEADLLVNPDE